jgi:hypothetical protein
MYWYVNLMYFGYCDFCSECKWFIVTFCWNAIVDDDMWAFFEECILVHSDFVWNASGWSVGLFEECVLVQHVDFYWECEWNTYERYGARASES